MTRMVQTILGIAMLGVSAILALNSVTPKGEVVATWPVAVIVLFFGAMGGFFVSKSLMTDLVKTFTSSAKAWRKP